MGEPLYELLHNCIVRIDVQVEGASGFGTGFFVAPGLILTCAHNVEKVKHDPNQITISYNENKYKVVELLDPFLPAPYPDLALLRIDLSEHPCVYLDTSVQPFDKLYTYGYTRKHFDRESRQVGQATTVEYEGKQEVDPQQWSLKFKEGQILHGYSGSPLLNKRTWGVCGIVQSTREEAIALGGGWYSNRSCAFEVSSFKDATSRIS